MAFDIMTERFEITSMLQRALVNDADVFGSILNGTTEEPAVYMESVHHILKLVAGVPDLRPVWFFDVEEQGEALADVGTHLRLVQWTLFPDPAIDFRNLRLGCSRQALAHHDQRAIPQVTNWRGTRLLLQHAGVTRCAASTPGSMFCGVGKRRRVRRHPLRGVSRL